jgi:hypothetical protein
MATSLGEAYSILGSAQGAEFKRRREEERNYYATQERKATQNMLLGYLIKPIGEQIAEGFSDVISAPFRDPVKKLLDSEQARSLKTDINKLNKLQTSLTAIQKEVVEKHNGDINSYAFSRMQQNKTREVFDAYKKQYVGLTDDAIRTSQTDIGIAYRKDLQAALANINTEAEEYASKLNNAFTASASMSTTAEIKDTLEKVTPYSKGIASAAWNMGSSLFRGEPLLGGPSKARMEESLTKAREILDFTPEEVEALTTTLSAGASNRTFEKSLLTIATTKDIQERKEYFNYVIDSTLAEDINNGKYSNKFAMAFRKLTVKGVSPSYVEVRNYMAEQAGPDGQMSGDEIKNIEEKLAVTDEGMTNTKNKFIVDYYNKTMGKEVKNFEQLSRQRPPPPGFEAANARWELITRVATREAAESVLYDFENLNTDDRDAYLENTSKVQQLGEVENRTKFIINTALEKEQKTSGFFKPLTIESYTGMLKLDKPAYDKTQEAIASSPPVPTTGKPVITFNKDLEETLKAVYLRSPDDFNDLVNNMRTDPRYAEQVPDDGVIKLLKNSWKKSATAPTPTVGSTAATVSGGVSNDPVSAFNQRRAQEAQEQLNQAGSAISSTVASLRAAGSQAMRQAYPATDRTTGGPTTTRSAVLGAPGTMGAEPLVAKVLNTITDRAGQQQLVENIRPTDTRTTRTPTPGVSNRSLLALPATAENNMLPEVKTKERKPTPVSPEVAEVFSGLNKTAVEKVRGYLKNPNADTSEDVLSDLAKASGYDPDVIELLRVSYNYEPNNLALTRYPQFNPSGSVEEQVKFMASLPKGKLDDFFIDVQASKVMSEDNLKAMIETYLDLVKKGNI